MAGKILLGAYRVLLFLLIIVCWEGLAGGFNPELQVLDPLFVSRPSLIASDLVRYANSGLLFRDLTVTLEAAFLGLVLGLVTGVLIGLLLGHFKMFYKILNPYLTALNCLPRPALAPLLILWFGLGINSKIFLSWSLVFFIVFFNTIYGIESIDPDIIKAIKVMGASTRQIAGIVIVPSVFTWIFAAFRTSVSFALIGAVVGEFVGSTAGLGYRSLIAAGLLHTERVFGILFVLMVLGVALVYLSTKVENYLLRWRPPSMQ